MFLQFSWNGSFVFDMLVPYPIPVILKKLQTQESLFLFFFLLSLPKRGPFNIFLLHVDWGIRRVSVSPCQKSGLTHNMKRRGHIKGTVWLRQRRRVSQNRCALTRAASLWSLWGTAVCDLAEAEVLLLFCSCELEENKCSWNKHRHWLSKAKDKK